MHPIAFRIGDLSVHWYGILVALGFILGFWTAGRRAQRNGISSDKIMDLAPWILIPAIIGARGLHVISYWQEFADKSIWTIFNIRGGGLVFYGGFIGACLGTIAYARIKKIPLWKLADALAPSVALGHAFGRLGCLMTGCCYGTECTLPWAIQYPHGHETFPADVHPVQVYEALLNFALYAGLAWFYRRKKFDGQIFATYLILYAIVRSFTEMFRADYSASEYFLGFISPGQLVSIFIITFGVVLFWYQSRQKTAGVNERVKRK
ncbi:MAG: prolipoprotein diacylglyceryl transferase [Verrucomicrobia bacterium]|nr:prolipoprotein diacylglyceryl transferase [Verrucomicrobiota bacterium]